MMSVYLTLNTYMVKESDSSADFDFLLPDSWLIIEDNRAGYRGFTGLP